MKFLRTLIPLLFLIGLIVVALPVSADAPGSNEDPLGGLPISTAVPGDSSFIGRFGYSPEGPWLLVPPGGIPSFKSGDGTTPRRAINISGLWSGESPDPLAGAPPRELPNCATLKIPAGKARWFKLESYGDRRTQIWLDDELDGAKTATGSSTFGAADQYMLGTTSGGGWQVNSLNNSAPQTDNFLEGFVMAVYDPDNLKPMWAFQAPNAAILSVNTDERGLLLSGPDKISITDATGAGIHGYGSYNPNVTGHLLWYEGRFKGWVFVMVYNQMIWDGTASVCSQRLW